MDLANWAKSIIWYTTLSVGLHVLLTGSGKPYLANVKTSGKMLLSEPKKGNMSKAKTLIEKVGTFPYLKQVP